MVIDKIENILLYKPMIPTLEARIMAVRTIEKLESGKYRFDRGYFNIQKGETKPMNKDTFETHRRYIDVQIPTKGCKGVVWADMGDLKTAIPYDREKDAECLSGNAKNHIRVGQGMFHIAFPHDGHEPASHTDESHSFIKIIMKIPVPEHVQAYSGG